MRPDTIPSPRAFPRGLAVVLAAALVALGCGGTEPAPARTTPVAAPEETPVTVARSPSAPAVPAPPSPGEVAKAVRALGEQRGIRTVQVRRGGDEIARQAFRGAEWGPWDIKSASKSILSAVVGIALENGILEDVDRPIGTLLPSDALQGLPREKLAITLEDLLTMRSGLGSTSGEQYGAWVGRRDWVRGALERPLEHPPGTVFSYSTGNSHLISAILTHRSGRSTRDLLEHLLGDPLGLDVDGWERSPEGIYLGGNVFRITPDELAAFGRLYLARGTRDGTRIVPADWIERSTRRHAEGWPDRYGTYGYLWWLPDREDAFLAVGYGGQFLYVDPATATVVVVTSTHESKGAAWDRKVLGLIEERILGGVGSPAG